VKFLKNDVQSDLPSLPGGVSSKCISISPFEKFVKLEETYAEVNMAGDLDSNTQRDLGME